MLKVTYRVRCGTKPSCMDFNYCHVPNTTPNKCHYEAVILPNNVVLENENEHPKAVDTKFEIECSELCGVVF